MSFCAAHLSLHDAQTDPLQHADDHLSLSWILKVEFRKGAFCICLARPYAFVLESDLALMHHGEWRLFGFTEVFVVLEDREKSCGGIDTVEENTGPTRRTRKMTPAEETAGAAATTGEPLTAPC